MERIIAKWYLPTTILVFAIFCFFIQSQYLINYDVAWLLSISQKVYDGGTYVKDFFENNPPLILYLYLPPVILSKIFTLNLRWVFEFYIVCIGAFSLGVCHHLLNKIFLEEDALNARLFILACACLFFIYPMFEFGQREHIMLMCVLPYLLLSTLRALKMPISPNLAFFIALLAGIGFGLKPFFLATFGLVELYLVCNLRSWRSLVRIEALTIAIFMVAYLVFVYIFHPQYLFVVVPFTFKWGIAGEAVPWEFLILNGSVVFSCIIICATLIQSKFYPQLHHILLLATVGFIVAYFIQRRPLYYHIYPFFSLAILLGSLLFSRFLTVARIGTRDIVSLFLLANGLFIFNWFYCFRGLEILLLLKPSHYFIFLNTLLAIVCLSILKLQLRMRVLTFILYASLLVTIMLVCYWFAFIGRTTSARPFLLFITTFLNITIFVIFSPLLRQRKEETLVACILAWLIFSYPFFYGLTAYNSSMQIKQSAIPISEYLNKNAPGSRVYLFSSQVGDLLGIYTANATLDSRFSAFWMLPAIIKYPYLEKEPNLAANLQAQNFLIDMIATDLEQKKPDLVLIDNRANKPHLFLWDKQPTKNYQIIPIPFDYLTVFGQNKHFQTAWLAYRYRTSIHYGPLINPFYDYLVYERFERVVTSP